MPTLSDLLRPLVAGRKLVLAGAPLAAMTGMCRQLRELGAERPFLLATGIGTGEVPAPEEVDWCVVEVRAPDVVAAIRAAMRLLDRGGRHCPGRGCQAGVQRRGRLPALGAQR